MGRDAPTEEKRKQNDATLQIMSIHYSLYKSRNIKDNGQLGQNTTEKHFEYIFYTNNEKTLRVLLINNFAEELLV